MKTILITGASRGIGAATAKLLAKDKNKIIVGYKQNKKEAENIANICANGSYTLQIDVSDDESIKRAFIELKDTPDTLINNAGVLYWQRFESQTFEQITNQCRVNYEGLVKTTKEFLSKIKKGIIINITSVAATYLPADLATYNGTKAAVIAYTKTMAKELPKEIKMYCISPGLTATDMTGNQGVAPIKVAEVIKKALDGEIKVKSGDEIDVREYY